MNIGKLRHRIIIQNFTTAQDSFGEVTKTYGTLETVWGRINPLSGRELEHARQVSAEVNHMIEIRHNTNVTVENRMVFDGRTYEVNAVITPDEVKKIMHLYCKEIV